MTEGVLRNLADFRAGTEIICDHKQLTITVGSIQSSEETRELAVIRQAKKTEIDINGGKA